MEEKDKRIQPVERPYMANTEFRQRLKEKPKANKKDKRDMKEFRDILMRKYEEKDKGSR